MAQLKNIPIERAKSLNELIDSKPHQVVSKALTRDCDTSVVLMAFSDFENVSEEEYYGDTLYYVLEGYIEIKYGNNTYPVNKGEVIMVPSHVLHSVDGNKDAKFLQITVKE